MQDLGADVRTGTVAGSIPVSCVVTCSERSVEAVWMYLVYIGTLTSAGSGGTPFEIVVQHYLRKGSVVGCAFFSFCYEAQEHSPL